MFRDRADAGRRLAAALKAYTDVPGGLVVALPRGGVVTGVEVSLALRLPLDVFIVRKIGYPGNPECAMAALTETGLLHRTEEGRGMVSVYPGYLEECRTEQEEEINRRVRLYRGGAPFPRLDGRTVLLVDDGLATGATFEAAALALRELKPKRLVGAVPVAPPATAERVRALMDELVVLEVPAYFMAVGQVYADFRQVDDAQVLRLLKGAA
ncbi:MAG: phosphoribosyltransferase [Nitrospirae bacterium]|nr:phosphoribosyltransferase [Nitrospirota bacterium]